MESFTFETQGTNTYLVYEIKADDSIDSLSLGMLANNKIHGLAQTLFTQLDNQKYIKFNVSTKISVAQFFAGSVNKKRLMGVFTGIVNAMLAAEDYMLDPASIIMDMNYIFTDVSTCETDLICLPIIKIEAKPTDLGLFFRNIMFNTQFDQTENCDHVAKIINYLNSTPQFSLNDFKKLLEGIQGQKVQQPQQVIAKVKTEKASSIDANQQKKLPVVDQPTTIQTVKPQPVASQVLKVDNTYAISDRNEMNLPPLIKSQPAQQSKTNESEISFFYLLQHYNKENAAAYKAQKEANKKGKSSGKTSKSEKSSSKTIINKPQQSSGFGFAVPGQAAPVTPVAPPPPVTPQPVTATVPVNMPPVAQKQTTPTPQPTYIPRQVHLGQSANFGETTVLGGNAIGETTVLTASNNPTQNVTPHLLRKKNNEKIALNKPVFRVGKERSYVDYFIGDNTAISRSHANFITRDSEYFVVDTNSTNHTFVNDTMLQSNIEMAISHGDVIRLANEEFEFKLY